MQSLFEQLPTPSTSMFAGAEYSEARDGERLLTQVDRIRGLAIDGKWRTIQRLAEELRKLYPKAHFPENSVQAQLRNLKKIGYRLNKRNIIKGGCLFEYQLLAPVPDMAALRAAALRGIAKYGAPDLSGKGGAR